MANENPTSSAQPTQPKKGEPIQIPVPTREDFEKVLARAADRAVPPPKKGSSA